QTHRQKQAIAAIEQKGGIIKTMERADGPSRLHILWEDPIREYLPQPNKQPQVEPLLPTDADLAHLQALSTPYELELHDAKVDRDSIKGMQRFSDAGLKHLTGSTQLRGLRLHCSQVTDQGLWHLRGLTRLDNLSLTCDQVTDAGLTHLRGLTGL